MAHDPRTTLVFDGTPTPRAIQGRVKALAGKADPAAIAELDRVTIGREVEGDDGERVPAGSTGTVVGIWAAGAAFEVEFSTPISALATVKADAILSHTRR